ncbi:MAG: hypothetical protein NTV01_14580, partial [Bacteroidia bacterium]|nr:hypothetical protein [Bacteroidia bacterium]
RYKDYSKADYADRHKQAAYSIKWISKLKPIQLTIEATINKSALLVNSSFALFVGFSFLDQNVFTQISPKLFQHLLYTTHYRNISGKQLATSLYILECAAKGEMP